VEELNVVNDAGDYDQINRTIAHHLIGNAHIPRLGKSRSRQAGSRHGLSS
jgi:hypothetical protein